MYVINRSNMFHSKRGDVRVTICTIDEEFIAQFCKPGYGDGQIVWPTSIAVDRDVNVYVSDEQRNDVQMFDRDGNFIRSWGGQGSELGKFNRPSGLATDSEGNVLVVDSLNNRVQKFAPDGRVVLTWGEPGQGPGQFNIPWGIAVDKQDQVYVVDWRNGRVQKFDADGNHLADFGDRDGEGKLDRPAGVDVDSKGNVYVSDYGQSTVKMYAPDGTHLTTLVGDGSLSKWALPYINADPEMKRMREEHAADILPKEKVFKGPIGIAVDDQDRVLIADCLKHRVMVYEQA
jgi:DNA-binding beta-propeller fold protein YncE